MNQPVDYQWRRNLELDVRYGYLEDATPGAPRQHHPQVVLNTSTTSLLRVLREELARSAEFCFSVAFVTPRAIALLKQELAQFGGHGTIITSDYLGFNSPAAFRELANLTRLGIDARIHRSKSFHAKGYIFGGQSSVTAIVGSSNLTENALVTNHEWNLKVTAGQASDLASQFHVLMREQFDESTPLTEEWIDRYAATWTPPMQRPAPASASVCPKAQLVPNAMQAEALAALAKARGHANRALVISATGTGKTILSAFDVQAASPDRVLFVVHREQILDRTIEEYQRVLGGRSDDYGKLAGGTRQIGAKYLFATVQTLSQPDVLDGFAPDSFDYIVVDEAHRSAANTHRRILDHFAPTFLLGMTATPDRSDGADIYELYEHNVPFEIRLGRALEEGMLCPFHYYGVTDVTLDDGTTLTGDDDLNRLVSPDRVQHLIETIELYGQASVAPRGLIFCSRVDEAHSLSDALNQRLLRGQRMRTVALTGSDSIDHREQVVEDLEAGLLDYILTVDVFNEGVDIPTVNQVIMLRQTQSAIIFVQQLGRGLRKSEAGGKDYVVVIDFIGNYANNYLIPMALFGDQSLNKESLRKELIAAEEAGVLPGLSSVRFDRISQARVLQSISQTNLDSMANIKQILQALRNRLGRAPKLTDFLDLESADPVLMATKLQHYPALLESKLSEPADLTAEEGRVLSLLSHEVLPAKRPHELTVLRELLTGEPKSLAELGSAVSSIGVDPNPDDMRGALESLSLEGHSEGDRTKYGTGLLDGASGSEIRIDPHIAATYATSEKFRVAVDDLIAAGLRLVRERYAPSRRFTVGRQYSRKEVMRLLNWPRRWSSTVYGYRADRETGFCPIFVTLHKSNDVSASTAYEDALLDRSSMRWYTRSRRTLKSDEVRAIVNNDVALFVFVKKDDAEGTDFYFLGTAITEHAEETKMSTDAGDSLDVVRTLLRFEEPIDGALFDYFHPALEN